MSTSTIGGLFIGVCVDNKDPKRIGRIKVRVPIIYGNIPTKDLPWAEPSFPYTFQDQGFFFIPEVGALISVMFLNGSKIRPVWLGGIHRPDEAVAPQVAVEKDFGDYPERKVLKTKTGFIMFDDDGKYMQLKHKCGSEIILDNNGDIMIHAARHVNVVSGEHIHLNCVQEPVLPIPDYKPDSEKSEAEKAATLGASIH